MLAAIGNTPMVRFDRLLPRSGAQVWGKLEMLNPGGSSKDRPALSMLTGALAAGRVRPGDTVIESSSGNMAVGLAQACRLLGLHLVCVVDVKTTQTNVSLMRAYGAHVDVVQSPDPVTGDWLDARLARVQALVRQTPGAWWPDQYGNPDNATSHAAGTATEIAAALGGPPTAIVAAASTCGLLGGLVAWRDAAGAPTRIIAVDVRGSRLFGGDARPRQVPGIGSSKQPRLVNPADVDVELVDDADCVAGCRFLLAREAVLAGGSAGAVIG